MNRAIFDVNDFLDRLLFRPIAELYRVTIPPGIRDRLAHVISNFKEPVVFANNLMQGEITERRIDAWPSCRQLDPRRRRHMGCASDWGMPQQKWRFRPDALHMGRRLQALIWFCHCLGRRISATRRGSASTR